jgi:hypothetical protein
MRIEFASCARLRVLLPLMAADILVSATNTGAQKQSCVLVRLGVTGAVLQSVFGQLDTELSVSFLP